MYLSEIVERLKKEDPERIVPLGWDDAYSWRGDYAELAVRPAKNVAIGTMLRVLQEAIGKTFEGYKGGSYRMGEYSDVYMDKWGECPGNKVGYYLLEFVLGNQPDIET